MPPNTIFIVLTLAAAGLLYWWYNSRQTSGGGGGKAVLATHTRDLTKEAEAHKLDPVIGRNEEIERVIHILSRRTKNNPLLLGEPGVGKTAIVEGIARRIAAGEVPDHLKNKRVLALDLGGLISGTKYRGEFEERMKSLTDEIETMKDQIILFIDELHMLEQAKGAEGAMNASDILKPALSRGELHAIGATTWKEYERFIRPDDALDRRFQPVVIGEPSDAATLEILQGIKDGYEKFHGVRYDDDALATAVKASKELIKDRFLPDKAIDLIDEAGAKASIEAGSRTSHALGLLHAAGEAATTKPPALVDTENRLLEELKHLRRLEETVTDEPGLSDIRSRLEKLAAERLRLDRSRPKPAGTTPTVTSEDIESIAKEWVGRT